MLHSSPAPWLVSLTLLACGAALAQPQGHSHSHADAPAAAPAAAPEHAHAHAAAASPPSVYRSAFDGYRPFADEPPTPWLAANAAAARSAGHSAHAAHSSSAPAPAGGQADPHAGHAMPMGKPPSTPTPGPHRHGAHP